MELHERVRTIGLDLVNSYEKRVKLVNGLVSEAVKRVGRYCREQEELSGQLKENLARHEGMRKKDYDALMETVLEKRRERERETRLSLEKIWQEENEMIDLMREAITGNRNLAEFERMKRDTLSRHREREKEVASTLMKFQLEQEELSTVLKKLISKGREVRIKDFKAMVRTLGNRDAEIGEEIDRLLEEFGRIRQEVAAQWEGLFSYYEKAAEKG